jgi:LPS sulfotransferase NodH
MRYTEAQITSELLDQPEFLGEPAKIFICSTPRSGSYMLCRYMINAGLGVPHEYFNPVIMREIAPRLGLDDAGGLKWRCIGLRDRLPFGRADRAAEAKFLARYAAALIPRRCQLGVFAAKIHFDQYIRVLDNPVGHRLLDGGVFIHLFREDLLIQAVSRNYAYATGRWGIDDAVTTAPSATGDLLEAKGINRELETLADEDRGWRMVLARNGLAPMSISYEQLCRDPGGFVAAIALRLGIDPATLRQGYSEPIERSPESGPGLPSKTEVTRRYLAAMRRIGAPPPEEMPGKTAALCAPREASG